MPLNLQQVWKGEGTWFLKTLPMTSSAPDRAKEWFALEPGNFPGGNIFPLLHDPIVPIIELKGCILPQIALRMELPLCEESWNEVHAPLIFWLKWDISLMGWKFFILSVSEQMVSSPAFHKILKPMGEQF